MKNFAVKRRTLAIILSFAMVISSLQFPSVVYGKTEQRNDLQFVNVVCSSTDKLPYETISDLTGKSISLSRDNGITAGMASGQSFKTTSWDGDGHYWEIKCSTEGFKNLRFQTMLRSSGTGPAHFAYSYSVDGQNFINFSETFNVNTGYKTNYESDVPELANNLDTLYIRVNKVDNVSVNGVTKGTADEVVSGGVSNINNIILTGDLMDGYDLPDVIKPTVTPTETTVVTVEPTKTATVTPTQTATVAPTVTPVVTKSPVFDPIAENEIPDGVLNLKEVSQLEKGKEVSIIGQIAYRYGNGGSNTSYNSTILQDVIDGKVVGYQVYDALSDFNVGDVVVLKGTTNIYGEVPQLQTITEKTKVKEEKAFAPTNVTIAQLLEGKDEYLSQYVLLQNVTLGAYSSKNSTLTDGEGKTINIYKSPDYSKALSEGDKVSVYGVLSKYNTTYQLRVGSVKDLVSKAVIVVDENMTVPVAKWAGNKKVEGTVIYGDKYEDGDGLDTNVSLSLSNNKALCQSNTTDGVTNYYTGSVGLMQGDYYQLALNTEKIGALHLNFTMRGSNTGAKYFKVLYSTDGVNYSECSNISYTIGRYNANQELVTETYTNQNKLEVVTSNVEYKVEIPNEFANAKTAYIRVQVVDNTSIKGAQIGEKGVNRFTKISITGSPMVSDSICGYVSVGTSNGDSVIGQEIEMSTATQDAQIYYSVNNGEYVLYDKDNKPVFTKFPVAITAYATKEGLEDSIKTDFEFKQSQVATVKVSPNGGSVSVGTPVKLSCETEGAQIFYSFDEDETWRKYQDKVKLEKLPCTLSVKASKEGYVPSEEKTVTFNLRENENYNIYFGQIHSHTAYSDGQGTCEDAFQYGSTKADQIDFLAVTDHSNSFDNDTSANIKDGSVSKEWVEGHELAKKYTTDKFVGIYGYEMTWSDGCGHMNTFNTDGFLSRNMEGYKNNSKASLLNYYGQLKTVPESISQFNHPGTTFGDFYDFGYYDAEIDNLITTIEVGNGEGAIGSSGYFPSYEYYTRALDKGWHVGPTNNQDNHKAKWGDANTGRTVVLADSLTQDNIYDALRNMRIYATEDNDLQIQYTLNDAPMGTILEETPDTAKIKVSVKDPTDVAIGKVEVIVNGGLSVASKQVTTNEGQVEFELPATYSYYYVRVTQNDGNIAVTAPVWVSEVEAVGISSVSTSSSLQVKGEAIDVSTTIFNNETTALEINSIEYSIDGNVIHTVDLAANELQSIASLKEASYKFNYTHNGLGAVSINVTVKATLKGVEKVYNGVLKLNYISPDMVTRVVVDGTHNNDYVTGYYGGNVGNFADIAAEDNVQVHVEKNKITKELLADCKLLVVSGPARKSGNYDNKAYTATHYEDEFIDLVADYVKNGGKVILCGLADYNDNADCQTSTEVNKLLAAMGATTRLNSDEAVDDEKNGGQIYRLYFDQFDENSPYTQGITAEQTYSAYSGCSILLDKEAVASGKAVALVKGHASTYSIDSKKMDENYVEVPKGELVALGYEKVGNLGGEIFVGGTVFISDFEIKTEVDYAGQAQYANRNILLNILAANKKQMSVTSIEDVRKAELGEIFAIEGYVTAGTAVEGNAFFDTIYVQDDTAGITIFPVADKGIEVGQKIHIEGYVDAYQGDKELQVISYTLLPGDKKVYEPKKLSCKDAADYEANGGRLVQVEGTVKNVEYGGDDVKYITVSDNSGKDAVVFTDGYILSSTGVDNVKEIAQVGKKIKAVGLLYTNPDGVVLRVRDRAEIVAVAGADPTPYPYDLDKVDAAVMENVTVTESVTLYKGSKTEKEQIVVNIPEGAMGKVSVSYSTSNILVASVGKDGMVKGIIPGTATIKTKVIIGKQVKYFKTKVNVKLASFKITSYNIIIRKGSSFTFAAESVGLKDNITWKSSDTSVLSIDKNTGVATGLKKGAVTVTAQCEGKTRIVIVMVL